jgi:integrase
LQRVRKIIEGATSEADALTFRGIEIADAQRGKLNTEYGIKPKKKPVTFAGMVEEYLKWAKDNKRSWHTDELRSKTLKEFFAGKLLTDITPFLVEKYKMTRVKQVGKNTANKNLILGSQVFVKAIEWKKLEGVNPFQGKRFKLSKPKKPGCLSLEDVEAIIAEIPHPVKRDMVVFAFNTGWRIGEITRLKWADVDVENGLAWIVDPKNANTVEIELNEAALEIIARQEKRSENVFCKLNGEPWKSTLNAAINKAAERAGVYLPKGKTWHIFRRTWASMMLHGGCDVETLRQLGNWKDHSMPLWYADAANREERKKALNRIPKLSTQSSWCHSGAILMAKSGKKRPKTANLQGKGKVVEIG